MRRNTSAPDDTVLLYPESSSRRKLPINFNENNLELFDHELERVIPPTRLLEFHNVRVSADGFLFNGLYILPESFAFPANRELWKRRSLIKFFVNNYVLRRSRKVNYDTVWIIDDWSGGYFHWLTDVLTRLYVMRDHHLEDLVLLLPSDYESREFVQASLRCFDLKAVEFVGSNEVLLCRRLFVPTHTAPSGSYNDEAIRGVRNLLIKKYGGERQHYDRIYISRSRAPKRRILNEEAVSKILSEFDFQIIHAEDHSFEHQAQIFSQARFLVSNHGAGLTNMLFMPAGARVLELRHETDTINNCYFSLSSALDLNYFYQTCTSNNTDEDPHTADLMVDLATLKTNLSVLVGP